MLFKEIIDILRIVQNALNTVSGQNAEVLKR
jgi:hypothetical protein